MFLNFNALTWQSEYNKRVIDQNCLIQILKESSVLYLFLECSIISILSVLVTWNAISAHLSILPKQVLY